MSKNSNSAASLPAAKDVSFSTAWHHIFFGLTEDQQIEVLVVPMGSLAAQVAVAAQQLCDAAEEAAKSPTAHQRYAELWSRNNELAELGSELSL